MIKLLIIILIAIILASLIFSIIKKAVKFVAFLGLVIIIFILIASFFYPEQSIYQKGKNYILEKSGNIVETGKEKAVSYVVLEANQTLNKAKAKIMPGSE
jgi:purine-cytosine permease-like protein